MNILIATDGTLPVDDTVAYVTRLHREGDTMTVMTAVNLPRQLLRQLQVIARSEGASIEEVVDAAGPGFVGIGGGDRVAERLAPTAALGSFDDLLERYHTEVARACTQPMTDGLTEAGITAKTLVRETQNRTAATIIDVCRERKVDLLVIGSTGRGRFEGLVGSTGTKLVRHAPADVLMVRVPQEG